MIKLQRLLPVLKAPRRNIIWSTGLGYHQLKISSDTYFSRSSLSDTTQIYFTESDRFQLKQTYLDLYNSLSWEARSKTFNNFFVSIGLGVNCGIPLSSQIKETYNAGDFVWSTPQRQWLKTPTIDAVITSKARKTFICQWSMPISAGIDFSQHIAGAFRIEYFNAYRFPSLSAEGARSEGAVFSFSFIYTLH
jgi:hypothetical protein